MKGMSESTRFKLNTKLCEYIGNFIKKVSNKDLGLFEKRSTNQKQQETKSKVLILNLFNQKQDKFSFQYNDNINIKTACDLLIDSFNYK